jgi:HPt (histidine-containing phosphotransfer) domain-containing protein
VVEGRGAGSAPEFDAAAACAHLGGNERLLEQIIPLFLEECPRLMDGLRDALGRGSAADVRRFAHTLGGAADNLAASAVAGAARELDAMGRMGALGGANEVFPTLEAAVARLVTALGDFVCQPAS